MPSPPEELNSIQNENVFTALNNFYDKKEVTLSSILFCTIYTLEVIEKFIMNKFTIFNNKLIEKMNEADQLDQKTLVDIISSIRYFETNVLIGKNIKDVFEILKKINFF